MCSMLYICHGTAVCASSTRSHRRCIHGIRPNQTRDASVGILFGVEDTGMLSVPGETPNSVSVSLYWVSHKSIQLQRSSCQHCDAQ